jgi:ribonucleotide monophosphatase NagD (HAD superfamily)
VVLDVECLCRFDAYGVLAHSSGPLEGTVDAIRRLTDIRGANAFGIHSALVGTGVNGSSLATIPAPLRPTYRLVSLQETG